jgi:hypothetical protein
LLLFQQAIAACERGKVRSTQARKARATLSGLGPFGCHLPSKQDRFGWSMWVMVEHCFTAEAFEHWQEKRQCFKLAWDVCAQQKRWIYSNPQGRVKKHGTVRAKPRRSLGPEHTKTEPSLRSKMFNSNSTIPVAADANEVHSNELALQFTRNGESELPQPNYGILGDNEHEDTMKAASRYKW